MAEPPIPLNYERPPLSRRKWVWIVVAAAIVFFLALMGFVGFLAVFELPGTH